MDHATFVLIPGAGGDAFYWHLLEPVLLQHGHDVIAIDLPADDDAAGLPEYAAAVTRTVVDRRHVDRRNVVLVAQSMAGFTAPLVCQQLAVKLVVLVNAMIPSPGETPGAWWDNTGQPRAKRDNDLRQGRAPDADFDLLTYFFHDVPREVVDAVFERGEPRQSEAIFSSPCDFRAWPAVPTRVLAGSDDRFFPVEFQKRVARERLGITPDELPGGHLVALSHPTELAERLLGYATAV